MRYITDDTSTPRNSASLITLTAEQQAVASVYPCKVSGYYAGLVGSPGDAIWRQCIPDSRELEDETQAADPLAEETLSPVPGLIHRYPDRVVLIVSNR